ncbi:MAG: hypothetical protein IPH76_04885 [Xanthomonadales bacterium]|nr:hypothetical protein [Xanthomonadales bacterium]
MSRPVLMFALALILASAGTDVSARTSVPEAEQTETPCPDASAGDAGLATPAAPQAAPAAGEVPAAKPSNRAARQRWKALLPGSLRSVS